jgi:citrate lyase subunit beta/citryl-CoA lyase
MNNAAIGNRAQHAFRSVLFAPGNHPRRAQKVLASGADVAVLDLEDAVSVGEKVAARNLVVHALRSPRDCMAFVRVNGFETEWCYGDLDAIIAPTLDGVVLPKTESADQLRTIDWVISQLERERGLAPGSIDLMPIIETARGLMGLETILTATSRVRRVAFGGGDYTLDLDLQWSEDEDELAFARAQLVHWSRAARIEAPIDTVLLQIRDTERFARSARLARRLGFQGKLCIHPDQVAPANAAFTPTPEEVAQARAVIAAFADAERNGLASIQVGGVFVDYAIVYKAERIIALADRSKPSV